MVSNSSGHHVHHLYSFNMIIVMLAIVLLNGMLLHGLQDTKCKYHDNLYLYGPYCAFPLWYGMLLIFCIPISSMISRPGTYVIVKAPLCVYKNCSMRGRVERFIQHETKPSAV